MAVKGVDKIKENAPQINGGVMEVVNNLKAQKAALEIADAAKDGIKNTKVRRIVGAGIKAAKK